MTTLHTFVVVNYWLLASGSAVLGVAHVRAAKRTGAKGLLFVAVILLIEAAECAVLGTGYTVSHPPPGTETLGVVLFGRSLSWLRLGLGWGLLLGARYALLGLRDVRGLGGVVRLVWQGYTGGCKSLWCRLKSRFTR